VFLIVSIIESAFPRRNYAWTTAKKLEERERHQVKRVEKKCDLYPAMERLTRGIRQHAGSSDLP
jgi:hypothetical protein